MGIGQSTMSLGRLHTQETLGNINWTSWGEKGRKGKRERKWERQNKMCCRKEGVEMVEVRAKAAYNQNKLWEIIKKKQEK